MVKKTIFGLMLMGAVAAGSGLGAAGPVAAEGKEITVSAAISLKNAYAEIAKLYEEQHPGVKVTFNLGASGDLMKQIAGGAPVDVFASAAMKDVDELEKAGLVQPGTRVNLAGNAVVLVQPAGSPVALKSFEDLTRPEVKKIALGNPKSVPAGRYAVEVLTHYRLQEVLKDKFILAENVRQVLDYVARGEVDAGVVYRTDALTRPNEVTVAATAPPGSHRPVVYPAVVIKGASQPMLGDKFLTFGLSPAAQAVLQKFGFSPASP